MKQVLAILILFITLSAAAQDIQFSQYYASQMYLNPGFTGNTVQARAVMNYRNQWPAMSGAYVSYAASFDYNIDQLNSGVGISFQQDRAGSAGLRYSNVGLQYSYTVRISRFLAMKPGLSFSYSFRDINQNELIFGDQLIYDNRLQLLNLVLIQSLLDILIWAQELFFI